MKKILISFATLTLVAGASTSTTAWKQTNQKQKDYQAANSNYNLSTNKYFGKNTSLPRYTSVVYGSDNVIYALSYGLWESTDNGKTFTKNTSIPTNINVDSIYAYNGIVYAGAGNAAGVSYLYESTDNGQTFHKNNSIPLSLDSIDIDLIYAYNNVIYLGSDVDAGGGLYESTDNGQTFQKNTSFTQAISNIFWSTNYRENLCY